ncbi:hypothetical protein LEP1GSC048_2937 [Leptospira santarosai serovar Shermani str. 1342KT]|nr:hypothetical protein LEP1GSC048_2937 [Leptospira santarosai serovar Shermani str. 1342KT]
MKNPSFRDALKRACIKSLFRDRPHILRIFQIDIFAYYNLSKISIRKLTVADFIRSTYRM